MSEDESGIYFQLDERAVDTVYKIIKDQPKIILRAICNHLNLTQEELAKRLKVSFATVNRWEGGSNIPQKDSQDYIFSLYVESGLKLEDLKFNVKRRRTVRFKFDDIFDRDKEGKMICKIDPGSTESEEQYDYTFHKALNEISKEHRKILDEWCKAFLAKEYQLGNDIHPGCFTLEQRQVNDPNQFGWDYKLVPNDEKIGSRMKWETIETAPKDGSPFLCYDANQKDNFPEACIYVVRFEKETNLYESGFIEAGGECYFRWKPTHWMPLPKPPNGTSD